MSINNTITELSALLAELEEVGREYEFARGRAEAHKTKALAGDMWERMLYCGAKSRMMELQEKAIDLDQRITAIQYPKRRKAV